MKNINCYAFPSKLEDAMEILLKREYKAQIMAGGTLIGKHISSSVRTYLDIRRLPLKYIEIKNNSLIIGACSTLDEIDNSPLCQNWAGGLLSQVASQCSSQLIRNMATIGGNIARPYQFNIFPPVLMGLEAEIRLMTASGESTLAYSNLLENKQLIPGENCLILDICIPQQTRNMKFEFIKLAKTKSSWQSYINLFFSLNKKMPRFVIGALSAKPFRAFSAESAFSSGEAAEEVAKKFLLAINSAGITGYRAEVGANLLKRCLKEARDD